MRLVLGKKWKVKKGDIVAYRGDMRMKRKVIKVLTETSCKLDKPIGDFSCWKTDFLVKVNKRSFQNELR